MVGLVGVNLLLESVVVIRIGLIVELGLNMLVMVWLWCVVVVLLLIVLGL